MNFIHKKKLSLLTLLVFSFGGVGVASSLAVRSALLDEIEQRQFVVKRYEASHVRTGVEGYALSKQDPGRLLAMQEVSRSLRTPWESMLDDLQIEASPEILLFQVQPDVSGVVMISGRADSSVDFLAYAERLRRRNGWRDVVPVSEVFGVADITGKPLVFQLRAERSHEK